MTGRFVWTRRGITLRARAPLALAAVTAAAPPVAGLAGQGEAIVAALIAAFVFVEVVGKPWLLPGAATAKAILPLARQVVWKAAGVRVLYGAGAGVSALAGWRPALPPGLPVAMVLGAGVDSRAIRTPLPPDFDKLFEDGIAAIDGRGGWDGDPPSPEEAARDPRLPAVAILPETATDAEARQAVTEALEAPSDDAEAAMDDRVRMFDAVPPQHRAGRRGFIVWATDPATLDAGRWPLAPARALTAAEDQPAMLALCAERAAAALAARPNAWQDFPTEFGLRRAADVLENGARVNAALQGSAEAVREATPPEFRDGADGTPLAPETRAIRQAGRVLARISPDADDAAAPAALATAERGCCMALADLPDTAARAGDGRAARLLVLHATRADLAGWLGIIPPLRRAFDRAEGDAALTALFARRAPALAEDDMDLIWEMPMPADLRARAAALPEAAGAVMALHACVAPVLEPAGAAT